MSWKLLPQDPILIIILQTENEIPIQEDPQCKDLHQGTASHYTEKRRTHQPGHQKRQIDHLCCQKTQN